MLRGGGGLEETFPALAHTQVYVLSDTKGNQVKVCSRVAQWETWSHHWTELSLCREGVQWLLVAFSFVFNVILLTYKVETRDASHFRIGQLLSSTGNYWSYSIRHCFFSFELCAIKHLYKGKLEPELRFLEIRRDNAKVIKMMYYHLI